jgi:hypothetical protein
MYATMEAPAWLLKQRGGIPAQGVAPDVMCGPQIAGGHWLACASCGQRITTDAARIAVSGRHDHTFANPHGYVFHIGCFAAAVGIERVGPTSTEFSWFAGYSWQSEQCAACHAHLGWLFRSAKRTFHGLVLDNLMGLEGE